MKLRIWIALPGAAMTLCIASAAFAQFANNGVTTTPGNGTISVTNTFQVALAYNTYRRGGFIQNTGTAFQYVYLAGNAANCSSATKAASIQLQPPTSTTQGGSITFQVGQTTIQDTICITGTANDAFAYGAQ